MVTKHFRITTKISGINCRYGHLFHRDKGVFFVSYLLLHLVFAKIRCEEKPIGRDDVSTGDAAGGNGQLQEEKLVLLTIFALLCISRFNKEYH